jgi:outer membrane lipoprotein-sorting protein
MNASPESEFHLSSPLAEAVHLIASAPLDEVAVERVRQRGQQLSESAGARSARWPGEVGAIKPVRHVKAWRVGLAAAALLVAGAGVVFLTGEATALAQVAKALRQVNSATYILTQRVGDQANEITKVSLRDGVSRAERPDGSVLVFDPKRKRLLRLNPATKTGTLLEGATLKDGFDVASFFSDLRKHAAKVQPSVADREFDGKRAKGFVVDATGVEYNVWIDPDTSLPLQFQSERKQKIRGADGHETEVVVKETWSRFRFNEQLDAALFDADPPTGYAIEVRQLEDREKQLDEQRRRSQEELRKASSRG